MAVSRKKDNFAVTKRLRQMTEIRNATPDDAPALLGIYAPYVEKTGITFELEPPTVEVFRQRIAKTLEKFPYRRR